MVTVRPEPNDWCGAGAVLINDRNLLFARPPVLSAARVKENCFSLSFIATPSCQTWRRASTGKFCRVSGGFAPSPRAWAGGSGRAARQCARSSAIPGQTGPEGVGAGHKPAFKPAWKTRGLMQVSVLPSDTSASRRFAVGCNRRGFRPDSLELWLCHWPLPAAPRVGCSLLTQAQLLLSLRMGLGLHLQQVGDAGPTDRLSRQAQVGI